MKFKLFIGSLMAILSGSLLLSSGQVAAQSASAAAMLEEVVVTARRREESLQDLPLSIAAFSADALEAAGILSIEDASDFVPNVTLTTSDRANNTRIVIRGIGGGHPDPVFVFGSGMYIDGHYIPNSLGGYMSTMDIERIELLRGPQGTLFGKNVTGGAVNIVTAKPAPEFASSATLRFADHGQQDFRGMLNLPLTDNVATRIAVASEKNDGYYKNNNYNKMVGAENSRSINAAIRYTPSDQVTFDLNVNKIVRRDDNKPIQCNPYVAYNANPSHANGMGGPLAGAAPAWGSKGGSREDHLDRKYYQGFEAAHQDRCRKDAAEGTFVTSSDKLTYSNLDVDSAFAGLRWDSAGAVGVFNDLSVRGQASYRETDYDYYQDRDGSVFDIDNIGMPLGTGIGQDNLTRGAEIIMEGSSDNWDLTLGYNWHYELAKNGNGSCRNAFIAAGLDKVASYDMGLPVPVDGTTTVDCEVSGLAFDLMPKPGFLPFINSSRVENESSGVFAHLTYHISDAWDLDVGVRHTKDDRNFWNMETAVSGCAIQEYNTATSTYDEAAHKARTLGSANAIKSDGMCAMTWTPNFNQVLDGGFYNQAADTFEATTPMISLTRNLNDDSMVYFLISEGFLTGGFNTEINSMLPAVAKYLSYDPEKVINYEIGYKGSFMDGRVQVAADYFMMKYTNKQESISLANPDLAYGPDESLGIVTNVASVDISGIELEVRAAPWDGGFVSLDLGTLNNEYSDYKYTDPTNASLIIDQSNSTIQDLSADMTINVSVEHQFNLGNGATLTPRINMYNSGDIDYQATTKGAPLSIMCGQKGYTKVGARVTYVPAGTNWRASLFGNNITDEKILESCQTSRGVYRYRHERPAYWGLEFTADFGG